MEYDDSTELIRAAIRGDFPIEQLDEAAEHLVKLQIDRFQRDHLRPKSRVTVCQSCCGWSHHGKFCRGCKKLYGDAPLTAFEKARAKIAFDHKHYRDLARSRAEKDPPVYDKLDAIQYIMTPYAGAADRARRHGRIVRVAV